MPKEKVLSKKTTNYFQQLRISDLFGIFAQKRIYFPVDQPINNSTLLFPLRLKHASVK